MKLPSPIKPRKSRIVIIPLIDIMFFLLASFMMVSLQMSRTENIKVNLPSEAEAQQVPLEKTFEEVIERELQKAAPGRWRNVEVMNFGVPGYGMAQEYQTLHNRVWKYHPQIVVLATTAFVVLTNARELYPFPGQTLPSLILRTVPWCPTPKLALPRP